MKKEYVAPALEDLGSLEEQTQALSLLGIKLDASGPGSGDGSTFS